MNSKNKILLVEDDPNFGSVLRNYLELNDYSVNLSTDGFAGYDQFVTGKYDICILDVMMPRKDGFTLAKEIHPYRKLLCRIGPIRRRKIHRGIVLVGTSQIIDECLPAFDLFQISFHAEFWIINSIGHKEQKRKIVLHRDIEP